MDAVAENIEIDEGRMKDIFTANQEGKSAKEIAKALKLPLGTVKKILGEQEDKDYLLSLLDAKEDLDQAPRIWISTIHAIKGGEEDNVILCLDLGDKILKAIKKSQDKEDEEHRVWYVGVTRAKNNLYKLKARIQRKGYKL